MAKENIQLPAMSDQMTEAEILSWKVEVGTKIDKGDIICEISTDKVDMDLESPFSECSVSRPSGRPDLGLGEKQIRHDRKPGAKSNLGGLEGIVGKRLNKKQIQTQ